MATVTNPPGSGEGLASPPTHGDGGSWVGRGMWQGLGGEGAAPHSWDMW